MGIDRGVHGEAEDSSHLILCSQSLDYACERGTPSGGWRAELVIWHEERVGTRPVDYSSCAAVFVSGTTETTIVRKGLDVFTGLP